MMLIYRVFLIQIQFEKAVVIRAPEVFVCVNLGKVNGDKVIF